ncbi:MAG: PmoA family protein [Phycisphaerales bacterium]|nr:MAG: PmoA family protein [Phycisphaerales bacterium]
MQNRIWVVTGLAALVISVLIPSSQLRAEGPLARFTVEAGDYVRIDTPVSVSLEDLPEALSDSGLRLVEVKGRRRSRVSVQVERGNPDRLWWVLGGKTKAGGKRVFELFRGRRRKYGAEQRTKRGAAVSVRRDDEHYEIWHEGDKVLRYNHAEVPEPEGESPLYRRSGFIHPLWSPKGTVLTNIHPEDHIHHVGIWMPWTKTKFEGKSVDFWNLGAGQGTVRFVRYLGTREGLVFGGFEVEQEHVVLKMERGEKVVLREVWDVRVYNVGGSGRGYWLWDFKSTQRCIADSPLYQKEYHYGGFGFRGPNEWDEENAEYLTSEGKNRRNGHGTRARWCDTSGEINGWEGVTFYSHPENFEHPEPMRLWPEGQVFFNFAPSQAGDWVMVPGKDYVFRYRLYVHDGKVNVGDAERIWQDYSEAPKVTVERLVKDRTIVLFDGRGDLSKWTAGKGTKIGWEVSEGQLRVVPESGSIWTKRAFRDFKLHVEFRTPDVRSSVGEGGRGNSGVYIQKRYEVQILDSFGLSPKNNECGSLYKFRAPDWNVCKKPGEWQTYDITFYAARFKGGEKVRNARITVVHNGVVVHNDVELEDKTGAGDPEGPAGGPILLQDHKNAVCFRNIRIVPL